MHLTLSHIMNIPVHFLTVSMAPFHSVLILLFLATISLSSTRVEAQFSASRNISLGSSLSTTPTGNNQSFWLSPSGNFAFGFYPLSITQTFLVGIWLENTPEKTLVWFANRDSPPLSNGYSIILNTDGRLILRDSQTQETPISDNSLPASLASLFDNGNFVLYNSQSHLIWATFDSPTDSILSGQSLKNAFNLASKVSESNYSTGKYRLVMQVDANLVLAYVVQGAKTYITSDDVYWSSDTYNGGTNVSLNLDPDGHMYLIDANSSNIKNITNSQARRSIYRATVGIEGNFQLFSHNLEANGTMSSSIIWSAISEQNPCEIKGRCGFNSYCLQKSTNYSCHCPVGFESINQDDSSQGCKKKFVDAECGDKSGSNSFEMIPLENTIWIDNSYEAVVTNEQSCRQDCLNDCECAAVLFQDQICSKQSLPLRYMMPDFQNLTNAFIKVGGNGLKQSQNKMLWIGIALTISFFILVLVSVFLFIYSRYRRYQRLPKQSKSRAEDSNLRSFSHGELEKATGGFKENLGRGAFGTVFRGQLPNGVSIAVKKLEKIVEDGEKEFQSEVTTIGKTHHKNLVRLLGYCDESTHRLLVYQFMSNGSLANLLLKREMRPNWAQRVQISLGIARGLLYLHEECETQIIHCDIKPQNILLDEKKMPKISDFGLAKLMGPDQTRTMTVLRGTRGYWAPEWHKNMPITAKVDVYSYGIMLLEIICCRKRLEIGVADEEILLSDWVNDCFERGELEKLVREEEVEQCELERLVMVGLWCMQDNPNMRPSMRKVVSMLEGLVEIPRPPNPSLSE
ncbi:G-type lectin S-receptor-like serine/threonine-protein kinase LECRK3 [Amborella trichopoda]|nr:G-type lectin S-receptor-like serine/threonine-protein kinase LECRK3 [Amborella trichopoda]|eukprot:XP_020529331.1 G-type lectin S-receptor-like serine/threonine-protein kinase LECRK3 [Amborella trichopoda]